jgi:hypothetical protein
MALTVIPASSFLPEDGSRVTPSVDLVNFVQNTVIENLGIGEFTDPGVNFTYAATDAPATNLRDRSTLWFKKGEGVLYKWDIQPSNDSAGTAGMWVAMSVRREMMAKLRFSPSPYDLVWRNTSQSDHVNSNASDVYSHYIQGRFGRGLFELASGIVGDSGGAATNFARYNAFVPPLCVYPEGNPGGSEPCGAVVTIGWTKCRVASSMTGTVPGVWIKDDSRCVGRLVSVNPED